jgi:hypothetical protein
MEYWPPGLPDEERALSLRLLRCAPFDHAAGVTQNRQHELRQAMSTGGGGSSVNRELAVSSKGRAQEGAVS